MKDFLVLLANLKCEGNLRFLLYLTAVSVEPKNDSANKNAILFSLTFLIGLAVAAERL